MAEVTEKPAAVPLNLTAVAPVKFVPLIVTLVPAGPLFGDPTLRSADRTLFDLFTKSAADYLDALVRNRLPGTAAALAGERI